MRTFFLWYLLTAFTGRPLAALILVAAIVYFAEARYSGRYFNPASFLGRRQEISQLRKTLEVNPHDAAAHSDLGRLLALEGRYAEARAHLEAALPRMADSPETNYYLGRVRLQLGDLEGARPLIEKAIALRPHYLYGEPHLVLGRAHAERGDHRAAIAALERAVGIDSSTVEARYRLAASLVAVNRPADARRVLDEAAEAYRHLPFHRRPQERPWRARAARLRREIGR